MKRVLGMLLALMMLVSIPTAAFADTYDIANGYVSVYADQEGQTVYQAESGTPDSAPVITGSSETNGISVSSEEGCEANVTLQDVSAAYLIVNGEGDATITVEGSNTLNEVTETQTNAETGEQETYNYGGFVDIFNEGTTTLEGSGSLTANGGVDFDAAEVIVDGPAITGTGERTGIEIYPWAADTATVTVENGSLTGIATGYELAPGQAELLEENYDDDDMLTAGIFVLDDCTLNVNGGTVTGINENTDLPLSNPGIGFEEEANLNIGDNIVIYDAAGNDITEAAVEDPTVLNDTPEATITEQPPVINHMIAGTALQEIETVIKDAEGNVDDGNVKVEIYENRFVRITVRTAGGFYTVICGRVSLKDDVLVFTFGGVEYTLTEDNVLIVAMRNGGTVEVKLTDEVLEIVNGLF